MCNVGEGGGGEAAAHGEREIDERKMEEEIRLWFFVTTYGERLSAKKWNWYLPTRLSTLGNS